MAWSFLAVIEQGQTQQVLAAIERAIGQSFDADGARMTGAESRRRFHLCDELLAQLRGDLGWGLQRALDHLPHYLRCELDGAPWEPDARTIWMPGDGQ
jgi:hypothetical protein